MNKSDALKRQMANISDASFASLKEKFTELFGFDCGQTNVRNLRKRLIYKVQEIYYGGLSEADRRKIAALADKDPLANMKNDPSKRRKILKGTRLHRDWKGKTYEVVILGDGQYEFEEKVYRSLSSIADKITGTHWNGKKFFGVK